MGLKQNRTQRRPEYPGRARQWQGIIGVLLACGIIELLLSQGVNIRSPGGYLLLVVIFVTYWSGLRQGIIASLLSVAYLSHAYAEPGTWFQYLPDRANRLINATILYPIIALLVGYMDNRLRRAAIREWDAREKAEAEIELRHQSEEMQRFVNESAMDAVIAIDQSGHITLWNPSAERIFGWTADEALGQNIAYTIIPPAYRELHAQGLRHYIETKEARILGERLELVGQAKDGREFPIEVSIAVRETENGPIFIGFARDISEQKKLNDRLRQAQKMEAIGTLAGGIAHDFNNILAAISGNLALAREDAVQGKPSPVCLDEIDKSVKRAANVVKQILTFSRPKDAELQSLNVATTLEESVALLRAATPGSMEIVQSVGDRLPAIVADVTDIHQIVLNLGINAYHALNGKAGRFEIQATAVNVDEETARVTMGISPGKYVRLSFRDNGVGMNEAIRQRIFEPFFTTKEVGEGTGLGLAVVYGIVDRQGGAVTTYSEVGKGTVFHIYLPASSDAASGLADPDPEQITGNGERVLYIDDDEALVFMMKRMLGRLNYQVDGFMEPLEALEVFKRNPYAYDVVITDMSMPHLSGPDLVRQLHLIRPNLPIVMVTGYIRPTDLEEAKTLGICELVLKPNSGQDMSQVLHRVISTREVSLHPSV